MGANGTAGRRRLDLLGKNSDAFGSMQNSVGQTILFILFLLQNEFSFFAPNEIGLRL
jgi:hypothetical protein